MTLLKPFSGRHAFGVFLDNLNGYSVERTKALLHLYAILYEGIPVPDAWFLTNPSLGTILRERDGQELIRSGALIPTLRDRASSFAELLDQCREKRMHGLIDDPAYASSLDTVSGDRIVRFSLDVVGKAYATMSSQVLSPDVLSILGATEATAATVARVLQEGQDRKENVFTNSYIKDIVCAQIPDLAQAELVMSTARAPYSLNLPVNLGSGIAGPDDYRGHEVLAALQGPKRELTTVSLSSKAATEQMVYATSIEDPRVRWLLKESTLALLSSEDLAEIRSHSERGPYLDALTAYLAAPSIGSWDVLKPTLTAYFMKAAETLMSRWIKAGSFGEDLREGIVIIQADKNLRIEAPDKPVLLSGVSAPRTQTVIEASNDLVVVGRTINAPIAEEPQE